MVKTCDGLFFGAAQKLLDMRAHETCELRDTYGHNGECERIASASRKIRKAAKKQQRQQTNIQHIHSVGTSKRKSFSQTTIARTHMFVAMLN